MTHPLPNGPLMTFEEAAKLDPDEHPGELDAGRWLPVIKKNTWRHGRIVSNVAVLLKQYAKTLPGWSVSAGDPGTKLARNPDVLRGPDVAVEALGNAQAASKIAQKALEYLAAGAKQV